MRVTVLSAVRPAIEASWSIASAPVRRRYANSSSTIAGGKLAQIIRDSIKATGPIPLSRYMQFCLSHPTEGYYSRGDVFGSKGDFITSPEISQIFGELVAIYFVTRYLASTASSKGGAGTGGAGRKIRLVELGPGRGTLMDDILRTLFSFPAIADKVETVHLIENSLKMRDLQGDKLGGRTDGRGVDLKWSDQVDGIEGSEAFTMVVAHEFFDAMPINLFEKREDGYREVLVDTDPQYAPGLSTSKTSGLRLALSRVPTPLSTVLPATSPRFASLPIGSRIEVSQDSWKIARRLGEIITGRQSGTGSASALAGGGGGGAGLIVDYGGDRAYGSSFRAFRNHKIVDVFDQPGSSDLTANVDFAYLREALEGVARPLGPIPQSHFLLSLGLQARLNRLIASAVTDERRDDMKKGARRLVDDLGMGKEYQVMGIEPLRPRSADGEAEVEEEVYPFIKTRVEQQTRAAVSPASSSSSTNMQ